MHSSYRLYTMCGSSASHNGDRDGINRLRKPGGQTGQQLTPELRHEFGQLQGYFGGGWAWRIVLRVLDW